MAAPNVTSLLLESLNVGLPGAANYKLVRYLRNTQSSAAAKRIKGTEDRFQQDIEPAGRYFLIEETSVGQLPTGWERGTYHFNKPLLIKWNASTSGMYDQHSWKMQLSTVCKAKGRALSVKLRKMGYDAIITFAQSGGKWETSECVDLTVIQG